MKIRLLILFALMIVASTIATAKEWQEVRFGIEGAYPPFSWTEVDGSLRGFDVDMANALCEEMQVKCKIIAKDWNGIIPALLAQEYDAIIAAMSITEARKKKVDFTHKYAQIPNKFVAKKDAKLNFTNLSGNKVGVQRGTTHDKYMTDNYDDAEIVRYSTFEDAYLDLVTGNIDAILGDASVLEESVLNKPGGDQYDFVGPSLTDEQWFGSGFGIAVRKQDKELTAMLNEAILALHAKGIYQDIAEEYFDYDVYGE